MPESLNTILLLALPASGKSEVRRFLAGLSPEECRDDFRLGETLQLDDFPYVHLMRRIDEELVALGQTRLFFQSADKPFIDTKDWGTLIHLLNEDYEDLCRQKRYAIDSAAQLLLERIDRAGEKAGLTKRLALLSDHVKQKLIDKMAAEAQEQLEGKYAAYVDDMSDKTVVIEFARGGPQGASMPLPKEHGYRYALEQLSADILKDASILYVWVTPEESRRKNQDRSDPNNPGSILHHGVPIDVMLGDYGTDDLEWLMQQSDKPGLIRVEAHGQIFYVPVARIDNRNDLTTFIRNDKSAWLPEQVQAIHQALKNALDYLYQARQSL